MKNTTWLLALVGFAAIATVSAQQVYETEDAEGNPVFSDKPSQGAEPVDLPPTNVGDSVDVPPPQTRAPSSSASGAAAAAPASGDAGYQRLLNREDEDDRYRGGRLDDDPEARHRVGHDASETRNEVGHDARERRTEVNNKPVNKPRR